jgi:hypothetical protein
MHRSKNRSEASPKTKMTSPTKCCASGGSRRRRAPGSCSAFGSLVMYPAGILERDELATARQRNGFVEWPFPGRCFRRSDARAPGSATRF